MSNANSSSIDASEDVAVKAVNKRYEGLVTVRTKAVKGKGACLMLKPISQLPPLASPSSQQNHRKRSSQSQQAVGTSSNVYPISMVDSSRFRSETSFPPAQTLQAPGVTLKPLVLSGGKEDLGPLALLENSVKKLKSPKASPNPTLSKDQVNTAFEFLADWFYESCGSVSFSSLEHPKFKAFLNQVGLPALSKREFSSARLDSKFEEARMESEARIRDAAFFQVASEGWKSKNSTNANQCLVNFMVNLPNGTRVFQKVVYSAGGSMPSQYAEEVLSETIQGICGNDAQRCVGIVADKFKAKALRNLELQNHWMVNFSCQVQGFFSLIKDFYRELPLFRSVSDNCLKIAYLINSTQHIRNSFHKFRLQGLGFAGMLGSGMMWRLLSLVKMIMGMAEEIEAERPLVGQCLPLWEELRTKVKDWCTKYNFSEGPVQRIVERRFKKNYHPAWSAAFVLDPLYLVRDASGKYLPPFKFLTHEQEKDVDKLVTRLVSKEEAHIALMELMKWRSEGLDPLYAQAVQVKQRDPVTGKMKIANPQSSRLVWETCLKEFKSLGGFVDKDIQAQAWRAQKLVFVAAHAKLERRDFSSAEEKDAELFGTMSGEDDMLNETLGTKAVCMFLLKPQYKSNFYQAPNNLAILPESNFNLNCDTVMHC
ncbi:UNVERIFIED_CONTAM: hypothetical protein Scaly_0843600 [Sesamum calycinum]|uniref:DUF7963 domain-containing protein n=1 Tax=Sesamum calycinum TaxID=2727403 RepID=A0AAW2QV34_9LAMI